MSVEFGFLHRPMVIVELGFQPKHGPQEALAPEAWATFTGRTGLPEFTGPASLEQEPDPDWQVEFGPHTLISNHRRSFHVQARRPDAAWEGAVQAAGTAIILFGSGLRVDQETGAFAVGAMAAVVGAVYAGSLDVPELAAIPGLQVVPVNALRSYEPLKVQSYVLDTDVLIEIERFCRDPSRGSARARATRHLLVNIRGRDVLPGPALAQLTELARGRRDPALAEQALAAFERVMALSRREILDLRDPPAGLARPSEPITVGAGENPYVLLMYAGVLRLRRLWRPDHTLAERAESFEAFLGWMRHTLQLNAGLLVQVAFNLWMAEDDAHRQASRLLHFRKRLADGDLAALWGTAFDLSLIAGHAGVPELVDTPEAVILTFDQGLARMREFFEHIDIGDLLSGERAHPVPWNARVRFEFRPGLEHTRPRIEELLDGLQDDALDRIARGESGIRLPKLGALIEVEERELLNAGPSA